MINLKFKYEFILIILIILSITYTPNIKANADFNYNRQPNRIIGMWNHEGDNLTNLNNPMDVFSNQSSFIISDTINGRIIIVYKENWSIEQIIYPFTLNINKTKHFVSNIFQTVEAQNNNYFSIIENSTIVEYNNSGQIFKSLVLYNNFENSSLFIDLGIDVTTNPFQILFKYPMVNTSTGRTEGIFLFLLNQTSFNVDNSQLLLKTPLGSKIELGELIKFSYNEGHPLLPISSWGGINNATIVLLEFGKNADGSYNITSTIPIPELGRLTNDWSILIHLFFFS